MNLTFDEAIENHRKMWNWIADETERRKRIVSKGEYFRENNMFCDITNKCYCCEYGVQQTGVVNGTIKCSVCPINWEADICEEYGSPYNKWDNTYHDYKLSAKYARQIANLPVREEARR